VHVDVQTKYVSLADIC